MGSSPVGAPAFLSVVLLPINKLSNSSSNCSGLYRNSHNFRFAWKITHNNTNIMSEQVGCTQQQIKGYRVYFGHLITTVIVKCNFLASLSYPNFSMFANCSSVGCKGSQTIGHILQTCLFVACLNDVFSPNSLEGFTWLKPKITFDNNARVCVALPSYFLLL